MSVSLVAVKALAACFCIALLVLPDGTAAIRANMDEALDLDSLADIGEEQEQEQEQGYHCRFWCLARKYGSLDEVPEDLQAKVNESCQMPRCRACSGCTVATTPEPVQDRCESACASLDVGWDIKCLKAFQNQACASCPQCSEHRPTAAPRSCNETCGTNGDSSFLYCQPQYHYDMCGGCPDCCQYERCFEAHFIDGKPLNQVCGPTWCWRCEFCEAYYADLGELTTTTTGTGPWCFDHCADKNVSEQCADYTCQACEVCMTTTQPVVTTTTTTPNQCVETCANLAGVPWKDRCTLFQCMRCEQCEDDYVETSTTTTSSTVSLDYCGFWCTGETEEQTKQACLWSASRCSNCTICEQFRIARAEEVAEEVAAQKPRSGGNGAARTLLWGLPLAALAAALRAD